MLRSSLAGWADWSEAEAPLARLKPVPASKTTSRGNRRPLVAWGRVAVNAAANLASRDAGRRPNEFHNADINADGSESSIPVESIDDAIPRAEQDWQIVKREFPKICNLQSFDLQFENSEHSFVSPFASSRILLNYLTPDLDLQLNAYFEASRRLNLVIFWPRSFSIPTVWHPRSKLRPTTFDQKLPHRAGGPFTSGIFLT